MTLEEIAEKLIQNVGGVVTDDNIAGVLEVFGGIRKGVDLKWEEHLVKDTNETLFYNKVVCEVCEEPVQITRTRQQVKVKPC